MMYNKLYYAVREVLDEEYFYRYDHRQIFRMMCELGEASEPLDVITLSDELHRHDQLERVGGLGYLTELAANTPSATNIIAYANIVRELSTLRTLTSAAPELT